MQCVVLLYCCTSSTSVSERRAEKWRGEGIFKQISDTVERRITHSEADKHNEWMNESKVMDITLDLRFMQFRGWTFLSFLRIKSKIKITWHKNAACCILLIILLFSVLNTQFCFVFSEVRSPETYFGFKTLQIFVISRLACMNWYIKFFGNG